MKRYFLIFLLLAIPAWAQNPPASCVRKFYIDWATGNDANAGTSGSPWKRHPFMNGETVTYTHAAGDCFVFKGGVTWPNAAFQMVINAGGSVSTPDYYGIESGFGTGRAIFDMEDTVTSGDNKPVKLSGSISYVIIDNIEITRQRIPTSFAFGMGGIAVEGGTNIIIKNCWLHDWNLAAGRTIDTKFGGISVDAGVTITIDGNELGPARNNNSGIGLNAAGSSHIVKNNSFHGFPNAVIGSNLVDVHDNTFYSLRASFDAAAHGNVFEALNGGTNFYRNKVYDIPDDAGLVMVFTVQEGGKTDNYYDNILYDIHGYPGIQLNSNGTSPGTATVNIFNNTIVSDTATCISMGNRGVNFGTVRVQNNHCITSSSDDVCAAADGCDGATSYTEDHQVKQTAAAATTDGYTSGSTPPYKTTVVTGATVNAGLNLSATVPGVAFDYLGTARPQGAAYDVGFFEFIESGTPATSYSPTSLTFAEMPVGHGTVTQTITLTNVGSTALTVSSVAASGTNAADFHVTSTCVSASPIAASDTCTITIYFNPQAAGSRSGSVTVTSDAASSPDVLPLSGTAVTKSSIALVGVPQ